MFDPRQDGISHINVYSQGKTELGRWLTNFAHVHVITADGPFESIEGYWYWLSCKDDNLRALYGFAAKEYGRKIGARDWMETSDFQTKIKDAIRVKIWSNAKMMAELQKLKLPLVHYYVFSGVVRTAPKAQWVIDYLSTFKK